MLLNSKTLGAVIGAGVAALISALGTAHSNAKLEEKLDAMSQTVVAIQIDVAVLKSRAPLK